MSTTSSARSSGAAGLALACLAGLAPISCVSPAEIAPGAAAAAPMMHQGPPPGRSQPPDGTLLMRSVAVHRPSAAQSQRAGAGFHQIARDPLVIDVRVMEPIDPRPQDSAPVIILNGRQLSNTWSGVEAPDQLLAFLPDRTSIREDNQVSVRWAGKRAPARAPQPMSFAAADIGD